MHTAEALDAQALAAAEKAAGPSRLVDFTISEQDIRARAGKMINRYMNGHNHHLPESAGGIPGEAI